MKKLLPAAFLLLAFVSCKKSTDNLQLTPISDYAPLTVGKYVTYNLDSLVYLNFGTVVAHRLYQVKYETTDSTTDGLGRKGFRITRYIRTLPSGSFTPDNTFLAVNTGTTFEFTENNLRFLKLVQPFEDGKTWKGNSAIDVSSLGSDLQYLYDWDYTYDSVGLPKQVGAFNLDNTVTINQRDDSFNLPVITSGPNETNIATRDYSHEVYAKDIGLVYKSFLHYEYQMAYHGYIGYGITLTMAAHN